jgi:cell division protein FtsI (penicillin-binding protein 3)
MIKPTFLKRTKAQAMKTAVRVVKPLTSEEIRYLMRINAEVGSARKANIPGYFIGGKTGTADKIINGRYAKNKVFTTFMAVLPANKPKYLYLTILDEPHGLPSTFGFHTAAWNAGEITGKIITRTAPLLGIAPSATLPTEPFPLLAKAGYPNAELPGAPGVH